MTAQEQAFRTYYSLMTDAQLLATAANRGSFIELAQQLMTEELEKRHLTAQAQQASEPHMVPEHAPAGSLTRISGALRHVFRH